MERSQILDMMGTLKLFGMRSAYDEIMASGIKRQHEPPRIVGDLLQSEIAEKQARSIKYQITVAKLPLAKDIDDFDFADTPVNEALVRDLATGAFVADQRNAVLIGEEDWRAIQETMCLESVPGLAASIREARAEGVEAGSEELDW